VRGKFLQLARAHGRVVKGGVLVDLPLTHDLIAESIGSTRETVTLALRELMRSGFVSRVDRRYRLSISPEDLS
jgi:CRP-like cAMP-binding protein